MKKLLLIGILALGLTQTSQAQVGCDMMGLIVNVSDTSYIKLYHPGHYLTWPSKENVIEWNISDLSGNTIAEDNLIDESGFLFQIQGVAVTDTMNVTALLTNDSAGVACLIEDQLYWKERVYSTGTVYGRWEFVDSSAGVDVTNKVGIEGVKENLLSIYPNPAKDRITVNSSMKMDSYRIFNTLGEIVMKGNLTNTSINIESLNSGSYFIVLEETNSSQVYYKKFMK
jgi:hypothetical protein